MAPNYWAIVCPDSDVPGLWDVWLKEHCVAIGWPPDEYHLVGPTRSPNWQKARSRVQEIEVNDIVIPYLREYRFGTPGRVVEIAIRDEQWDDTVIGNSGQGTNKWRLGRRIKVEWMRGKFPPVGHIAVVPENMRRATGEVRQTLERVTAKRLARFMKIIQDKDSWQKYTIAPGQTTIQTSNKPTPEKIRRKAAKGSPIAVSALSGNDLYIERAREAFPILVRQALSEEKIAYSDLADEMGMPNPRNLNYVLGAIGKAIKELSTEWDQEIPPLQCVVVNKHTGMPGEGVSWFISDLKDFKNRTPEERKQILSIELVKVFNYRKWEKVLSAFGLKPIVGAPELEDLIEKARHSGGVGECEDHRQLKHYIANNPKIIGLHGFGKGSTEYCFPSADRIDVAFSNGDRWVGVEVKGPSSSPDDIVRGMFQTVKYSALREAVLKSKSKKGKTDIILVTSGKLTSNLKELKNLLGVNVIDGILAPKEDI
jgi:hypothetical protein